MMDWARLYAQAAQTLVGAPVKVYLRAPADRRYQGGCFTGVGTDLTIEVDPAPPAAEQLRVFLHECAHAKRHWEGLKEWRPRKARQLPLPVAEVAGQIAHELGEVSAEIQAAEWAAWARKSGGPHTVMQLLALQDYPDP